VCASSVHRSRTPPEGAGEARPAGTSQHARGGGEQQGTTWGVGGLQAMSARRSSGWGVFGTASGAGEHTRKCCCCS
jgi:hypothetical protein